MTGSFLLVLLSLTCSFSSPGVQPPLPLEAAPVDDSQQEQGPPVSILCQGLLPEAPADQALVDALGRQALQMQIL